MQQKHTACSYGYNIVYVDGKFRRHLKSYLGEGADF